MSFRETPPESPLVRFTIAPPANGRFGTVRMGEGLHLAVSPDGKRIVFAAIGNDGKVQLWLRSLDSTVPRPLAGTENAAFPFWKPDGKSIGFFAGGKLWRIDCGRRPRHFLWPMRPIGRGGTWNDTGVIVFRPKRNGPLYRVADAGGAVSAVTRADTEAGETNQWLPWFLPDGRHFLYATGDDAEKPGNDPHRLARVTRGEPGPSGCGQFCGLRSGPPAVSPGNNADGAPVRCEETRIHRRGRSGR